MGKDNCGNGSEFVATVKKKAKDGTLKSIWRDWLWIWSFSRQRWGSVVLYTLCGIGSVGMGLAASVVSKYLFDAIDARQLQPLLTYCILTVISAAAAIAFRSFTSRFSAKLAIGNSGDKEETFTVTVTVTEGEEGSLTAAVSPEAISVTKTYLEPLVIDVEKKWPDGGERPVTVWLYETRNGEKVEVGKITVAATTGWKGQFTQDKTLGVNLRPNGIYTVEEMDLYKFSESYSYNKNDPLHWVVTVTNKEALPQTGLRTEPVFFLFLTGMLCMAAGAFLLKKKDIYG